MEIPIITTEQFSEISAAHENCFLIFTKDNCPVCARLKPLIEKISDDYKDSEEMHFYGMEIHDPEARALFKGWQLVGVPQTVIINKGEFQEALPGALSEYVYRDEIDKLLGIKKKGFFARLFGK